MTAGHCRHCGSGCTGGVDLGDGRPNLHTDVVAAFWRGGHCLGCAEAERIAAATRGFWARIRGVVS